MPKFKLFSGVFESMEDTKAISPQVKGLVETIRSQAVEYTKAFEKLYFLIKDVEDQKKYISNLTDKTIKETRLKTDELEKMIHDYLEMIDSKVSKTLDIYDDLSEIRLFKDSMANLFDKLKRQEVESDNLIDSFKVRANTEIEAILTNSQQRIEKGVEQEVQRLEIKLSLRNKHLEGKVLNIDQKLFNISENVARTVKTLTTEIDTLKDYFTNTTYANEKLKKQIESKIFDADKTIDLKIERLEDMINSFQKDINQKLEKTKYLSIDSINTELNQLRKQFKEMDKDQTSVSTKTSIAMICGISGLLIGFISMLMYFAK